MMFLAPGVIYPGLPPEFAYPAAFGDLLAAVLAWLARLGCGRELEARGF